MSPLIAALACTLLIDQGVKLLVRRNVGVGTVRPGPSFPSPPRRLPEPSPGELGARYRDGPYPPATLAPFDLADVAITAGAIGIIGTLVT